ncbi:MAG: HD-GYP domain-containing protein [Solirubrobacterales bacterium]
MITRSVYWLFAVINLLILVTAGYGIARFTGLRPYLLGFAVLWMLAAFWWLYGWICRRVNNRLDQVIETCQLIVEAGEYRTFTVDRGRKFEKLATALNELQHFYQSVYQEAMEKVIEGEEMFTQMLFIINAAVEAKDQYTSGHSEKVAQYSRMIVQELGLNQELGEKIVLAALLHDVGKIGIRESILNKNGQLDDEEFSDIKTHTELGRNILFNSNVFWEMIPFIYHHHEHYNGKGYPEGLQAEEIPIGARIIAVADAYDAMTSDRPYRKAMPQEQAFRILIEERGQQFEGMIVDAFLAVLKRDQVGVN